MLVTSWSYQKYITQFNLESPNLFSTIQIRSSREKTWLPQGKIIEDAPKKKWTRI